MMDWGKIKSKIEALEVTNGSIVEIEDFDDSNPVIIHMTLRIYRNKISTEQVLNTLEESKYFYPPTDTGKEVGPVFKNLVKYETNSSLIEDLRARLKVIQEEAKGGYLNDYGCRVPNKCGEIDMYGRDMGKIGMLMQPTWNYSDELLNYLNAFKEPNCSCVTIVIPLSESPRPERRRIVFGNYFNQQEMIETKWTALLHCTKCEGTGYV